ncbi:AAA family ATPase [Streptomyces mirabilis]|uniref:AAA family ATPase n=1 Tax=Streptomyces mirabilis TaxID=68239 RepID=A0ABU3V5Z1_9ACTN|nr:helix-turn-helix transcriptional regulator [Streptomyces mirabilis]MCX5355778.1 AAA family ATPase [Streptomyces mirabilis]MDU9001420.1 AAA family ATPase [Streptomyces mirabilis]
MIGREAEFRRLAGLVDSARRGQGSSVLVSGEAGIGKSLLATAVVEAASSSGFEILSCHGIRGGGAAGFEGLHELLLPLLDRIDALPPRQHTALDVAFGGEGEPADRLITGLAVFGLLEKAAAASPLLVLIEDLHWLDRSTAEIVTFLAARMGVMPALLVATTRADPMYPDQESRFKHHVPLTPLSEEEALILIDRHAPAMAMPQRLRLVAYARGNPLALTEWSADPSWMEGPPSAERSRLPMGKRLEKSFLAEVALLPRATRRALLVAAAGEDASSYEVMEAARNLGLDQRDFTPAESFGLITVTGDTYRFRHPLVASAVYDNADFDARSRVHAQLAAVIVDPARAVQHRAAAVAGWNEDVAAELEEVAVSTGRRGALTEAAATWRRAASLTPVAAERARRTVMAAEAARQAGAPAEAAALLAEAMPIVHDQASLVQFARTELLIATTSTALQGRRGDELVALARTLSDPADRVEILIWAAVRSFLHQDSSAEITAAVADELRRPDLAVTEEQQVLQGIGLALISAADPIASVERALSIFQQQVRDTDATLLNCLAFAVEGTNDLTEAERVWSTEVEIFHRSARTSDETVAFAGRGTVRVTANAIAAGLADSEHALRLSSELGMSVVGALAAANIARARAWRGEHELATSALQTCAELSGLTPFARVAAIASWASAQTAANEHRPDEAVAHLLKSIEHPPIGVWAGGDLADVAVRAGRPEVVHGWLDMATTALASRDSDHLAMLIERSLALLTPGSGAKEHFEQAIRRGQQSTASLDLAKTRLSFGEWLRRERRIMEARDQLSAALHVFESHHAKPLAQRATQELRAAGGGELTLSPPNTLDAGSVLTAQELHIAQLAAEGYTNKQIADRVYLSHRTVGVHLYNAYAKLQINRRSQLAAVLASTLA